MEMFSRREFAQRTAMLSAAAAALGVGRGTAADPVPAVAAAKAGASDRLRVAVVGVKGRGMSHVGNSEKGKESGFLDPRNNTEIVAICDCDEAVIGGAMKRVEASQGKAPQFVKDFRKLLEDKSIDIISVATPNHWHALMAVWAMRAGKDVYVEKPATHNVHEGRLMAQAARKYKRICQVGTQSRSNPGMQAAIKYIHEGKIGKVSVAYGTCYKPRKSIGKVDSPTEPPKTMDYDLWCGPAPKLPVTRKQLHYDWHWTWAYGNGDFGNQGVHEADKARWGLGVKLPLSVVSLGGRFGYIDDGETPNTELCLYEYANDQKLIFEVRGLDTKDYMGAKVGNIWFGDKGYVVCPNYGGGVAYSPDGKEVQKFSGGGDHYHFSNFVKAVRSKNPADLNCEVEEGHYSAAICHLGNISYRLGQQLNFAEDITAMAGSKEAAAALQRMKDHLKDNGVDLKSAVGSVGPKLTIDPKTEKFTAGTGGVDLKKANDLLFREYRKGFDITEAV
jgi:predicted dehydrogenase